MMSAYNQNSVCFVKFKTKNTHVTRTNQNPKSFNLKFIKEITFFFKKMARCKK